MAKFLTNLNLFGNQIQNAVVHSATGAPTSPTPTAGQIYYNSGDELIYLRNDSDWIALSTGGADITNVIAGTGLTGGATSGEATLNVIGGTGITANDNDIQIDSTVATLSGSQTLTNKTIAISQVTELSGLTEAEGTQLEAIGTTTISATQWGYLGAASGAITNVNDDVSVANLKTALAGGFGSNVVTIGDSDDVVTIGNDLTVTGDLIVSGATTTVNTATLSVEDPLIALATGNGANTVDIGVWGKYTASGAKYTGLFRDASDSDEWKLFATTGNSHETPGTSTTINTTTGFTYANLTVGTLTADNSFVGDLSGNADTADEANVATHVTVTDNESTNEENQITFIEGAAGSGNRGLEADGDLTYNPSSGTVTATVFKGNIDAVDGDFDGTLETDALTIAGTAIVAQATASAVGGVELATAAEVLTGTDAARVVTADTLAAKSVIGVIDVSSFTDDNIVTITHNLGTADVIVEMYDIVTEQTVYADVYRTAADLSTASTSVISVQFGPTAPPNDINCLITSVKGATAAPTVAYT